MIFRRCCISGISYGNAIGSIICNTSLITALTIAIKPGIVKRKTLILPSVAFFVAALVYSFIAYTTGKFERWQGILFLCMFVVYMILSIYSMKSGNVEDDHTDDEQKVPRNSIYGCKIRQCAWKQR